MSIHNLCTPRESVFAADRRATVLDLDAFINGQVHGQEFFDENYFTNGMKTLVDRAFRHLSGNSAGSSIFHLSQAMGGGKTHSMIGLGLLAKDPELRRRVLGEEDPAPRLGRCRVAGFNGRNTDAPTGIWGSIAEQLGKADQFARYATPIPNAPGPEAWKQLLGGDPLVLFLDELPPYLAYAVAVPIGSSGNLGIVTTTALANLFIAVTKMDNVCLVISDLAGSSYTTGQGQLQAAIDRAMQEVSSEARRIAVPITPVNPNGDELYHILRKRLFKNDVDEDEITKVAVAYRDALRVANQMNLTTTTPESLYTRIMDSYPFHPDLRELVGKFKENDGFQQTRGVIRLMQMVVANLWKTGKAEKLELVHPYDIDLNNDEIASEIRAINGALSEAIAHDIAHGGDAEAEQIDEFNGNTDATETSRLILMASLSSTPGAIHGLREYQLIDCLQRPGRDLSSFRPAVLDKLALRAWYLHNSADGRLFFKNQQNLAAKLRSVAQSLHIEIVDRELKDHLAKNFEPSMRDCYQSVKVLPPLDEVQLDQDKVTLVITRPGAQANSLPISADWQAWWGQQQYKNRVLFLSGSRDTFQKVIDAARQKKALDSIEDELKSEHTPSDDPQWKALDGLRDRIALQFGSALKEAFDQLVFPSINTAVRSNAIVLTFAGNQNGEATIRKTLEDAQKFTTKIDDETFRSRAEGRLFGTADTKVILWSDLKRNAAVNTSWPLHKPSALDDLKADCLHRGLWREEGSHVRRGPFPAPLPTVEIRELSVAEDGDGKTVLKIEPLHAPQVVFETGDAEPTAASSSVPNPSRFEANALRYRFLAIDPDHPERVGVVREWSPKIRIKQQLHDRGDHYELELKAFPVANGIVIRYTTDGSAPNSAQAATYEGRIRLPDACRVVSAMASAPSYDLASETLSLRIPQRGDAGPVLDRAKPARWDGRIRRDDTGAVWDFIHQMDAIGTITAFNVELSVQNQGGLQQLDFSGAIDEGYQAEAIKKIADALQEVVGTGDLRMTIGSLGFATGQALLDWLQGNNITFEVTKVRQ